MSNQQQKSGNRRGGQGGNRSGGGANPRSGNGSNAKGNGKAANNGRQNDNGKSNNSRRRKGSRKKKVDPRVFWGDPELLADYEPPGASITTNPAAAVLSLGRPPLSGQQNAAEHYFTAVYDRAVNLAAALAAAGELIEPEEITDL